MWCDIRRHLSYFDIDRVCIVLRYTSSLVVSIHKWQSLSNRIVFESSQCVTIIRFIKIWKLVHDLWSFDITEFIAFAQLLPLSCFLYDLSSLSTKAIGRCGSVLPSFEWSGSEHRWLVTLIDSSWDVWSWWNEQIYWSVRSASLFAHSPTLRVSVKAGMTVVIVF